MTRCTHIRDCTALHRLTSQVPGIVMKSCSLNTPLSSIGRDYTLTMAFTLSSLDKLNNATLISGGESTLLLTPNITIFAGGNYYRLNTSLPLNQKLDLSIIARGNQTFAKIDQGPEEEFLTKMGINGERFEWGPMAFEAPLQQIGGQDAGWGGEIYGLKLRNVA